MTKLRIFIACADKRLRLALLLLLDQEPAMVVVGITDRLQELLPQLETTKPDVLLLEWGLSSQSMANLFTEVHNLEHPPKVVYFSKDMSDENAILAAGADHYICENAPPDTLLPILRSYETSFTDMYVQNAENNENSSL
jgi:DNA-binding NarL/FixJ family response regulator